MTTHTQQAEPAELWRRLAAIVYDSIIVLAIWFIVGFIVLTAFGIDQVQVQDERVVLGSFYRFTLFASMLGSAYLFFAWFWTHSGQTIGMQAWKIRIQNSDGSSISWKQSLIRCVTAPPALICLGAGYFLMLFNPERLTLPDILSGSVVMKVSFELKGFEN